MNPFPGTLNIDLLGGLLTCSIYAPSRNETVAKYTKTKIALKSSKSRQSKN